MKLILASDQADMDGDNHFDIKGLAEIAKYL